MAASTSSKRPAAKKAAPAKAPAGKAAAKKAPPAKRSAAAKPVAKKSPATKPPTSKSTAAKQSATKTTAAKSAKSTVSKPAAAGKQTAAKPAPPKQASTTAVKKTAATRETAPTKPTAKRADTSPAAAAKSSPPKATTPETVTTIDSQIPKPKFNKEGLGYTKDFDLPFIKEQYDLLQKERERLTGQALRLEDEAHQLVEEAEMGDVQYDEEGGEGDTMVVERERDLALSAQARDAVVEIDAALNRIMTGTYGYSVMSGRPIPKERLEAIPWSSVLVEEKVGGIGRR